MNNYPHATSKRGWVWGVSTPNTPPIAALNIFGDMQIKRDFVAEGKMGIGVTSMSGLSEKLTVNGNILFGDGNKSNSGEPGLGIEWHTSNYSAGFGHKIYTSDPGGQTFLHFAVRHTSATFTDAMSISSNGNVGIGTTKVSGFKLSVEGKMRAREIQVNTATWADFVFADDYQLNSLTEVENYITKNNHLPDVPSEKEVIEEGINLGEMDAILLRKIEELTLYIIEQDKRIKDLEKQ
jgi:hypothetical protein